MGDCEGIERCRNTVAYGTFCEPDPSKPQPSGKKIFPGDDWNALCDAGDACLTYSGGRIGDCGKANPNCNTEKCCPPPPASNPFSGGRKVCKGAEVCNTEDTPGGYPSCTLPESYRPKQGYEICRGRTSESRWKRIECPEGTCSHHPGSGYPVCLTNPSDDDNGEPSVATPALYDGDIVAR